MKISRSEGRAPLLQELILQQHLRIRLLQRLRSPSAPFKTASTSVKLSDRAVFALLQESRLLKLGARTKSLISSLSTFHLFQHSTVKYHARISIFRQLQWIAPCRQEVISLAFTKMTQIPSKVYGPARVSLTMKISSNTTAYLACLTRGIGYSSISITGICFSLIKIGLQTLYMPRSRLPDASFTTSWRTTRH